MIELRGVVGKVVESLRLAAFAEVRWVGLLWIRRSKAAFSRLGITQFTLPMYSSVNEALHKWTAPPPLKG
jgi:hypothetical protein